MISPNYDERRAEINMIVLHYTGMKNCDEALARLCDERAKVSAHYLIDEEGKNFALVPEDKRAWHAGEAFWAGQSDINSCAIGIELANGGYEFGLPEFPAAQMEAARTLCADLVSKYQIPRERVLAHSDIAPTRKKDPGEKFDWQFLAKEGIGLWADPAPPDENFHAAAQFIGDLAGYGYQTERIAPEMVVRAFQRHYRPARIDGRVDQSTLLTLASLTAITGKRNL